MNTKEFFNAQASSWDEKEKSTNEDLLNILKWADLKPSEMVLDLGCGTGIITGLINEACGKVIGMDVSEEMIKIARLKHPSLSFICDDFYEHEFREKFDKVIIFNAYPHFLDKDKFATKLASVLNDGGLFIILHNNSRQMLDRHHFKIMNISCKLLHAEEEAKYFSKHFKITLASEGDNFYVIKGVKSDA